MLSLAARLFLCLIASISTTKEAIAILNHDSHGTLSPSDVRTLIEQSLDADKAFEITTIDLDEQTGIADYMIIASGTSSRHVSALANKVKDKLESKGVKGIRIEGLSSADWVVIDTGDVIVHLFRPEVREFYSMEKMWGAFQPFHVIGDQVSA